jgi:uncharacterized protein (DUF4415 family)
VAKLELSAQDIIVSKGGFMKSATKRNRTNDGYENAPAEINKAVDFAIKRGNFVSMDEVLERSKKEKITLNIDGDIVSAFRNYARRNGAKYQTLMNEALRGSVEKQFLAR